MNKLLKALQSYNVKLIALEATGKYHRQVYRWLHDCGYQVSVVNPYRSRKFADALGQLAKTDQIDARILALMAEAIQPECRFVIKQIRGQLKMLNRHIAQIDKKIKELIKKELELARRYEILISIKGIGPVTAITLIADLEELGACSSKEM